MNLTNNNYALVVLICSFFVGCDKKTDPENLQISLGGSFSQGMKIERENGGTAIQVPDANLLVVIFEKDPASKKEKGLSCSVLIGESPIYTYYGIDQQGTKHNYMQFYSEDLKGTLRDNDQDGFLDEAILPNYGKVKLQTWIVDEDGKQIEQIGVKKQKGNE